MINTPKTHSFANEEMILFKDFLELFRDVLFKNEEPIMPRPLWIILKRQQTAHGSRNTQPGQNYTVLCYNFIFFNRGAVAGFLSCRPDPEHEPPFQLKNTTASHSCVFPIITWFRWFFRFLILVNQRYLFFEWYHEWGFIRLQETRQHFLRKEQKVKNAQTLQRKNIYRIKTIK